MLSKKMEFSLMCFITIFALAFVVRSAMAGDFAVTITGPTLAFYDPDATDVSGTDINEATQSSVHLVIKSAQALPIAFPTGITLYVEDEAGFPLVASDGVNVDGYIITIEDDTRYSLRTAKVRWLRVDITRETDHATPRAIGRIILIIPTFETPDPTVAEADAMSREVAHTIIMRGVKPDADRPKVVSIQGLRPSSQSVVSAFQENQIAPEPFDVRIVLTEARAGLDVSQPGDFVAVEGGRASHLVIGVPFAWFGGSDNTGVRAAAEVNRPFTIRPHPIEGMYAHNGQGPLAGVPGATQAPIDTVPLPSGPDNMYWQYRVTITPDEKTADFTLKVRVKEFHDGDAPRHYYYPDDVGNKPNGREQLRVDVKGVPLANLKAGYRVILPKDIVIPAGGYLVVAKDAGGSEVVVPPNSPKVPVATERIPAQMKYNVQEAAALPNLATALRNGVVVDVEVGHALVISEVMWGEDLSLDPASKSQWIELYNAGVAYTTVGDDPLTLDVDERLTLAFYGRYEFDAIPADATGRLPGSVTDRIGTLYADGRSWSPVGKGQGGRTGTGEPTAARGAFVDTTELVSMYRVKDATGKKAADGQMAGSWKASVRLSANFDLTAVGIRHGTPGAATEATETPADLAAAQKRIDSTGTIPQAGSIYISEVMFAGGGRVPQWIEIANGSRSEDVNLSGWTLTVDNAAADADVSVGATATFTIPDGTTIAPSERHDPIGVDTPSTILVVTEAGRNSLDDPSAAGQVVNLWEANDIELILAGVTRRRYTLLSDMAFMITLAPPRPAKTKPPARETAAARATREVAEKKAANARKVATDMVGNLGDDGGAAWALPMRKEGGRSSIIRRHIQLTRGPAAPEDGILMDSWVLASRTSFAQVTRILAKSYYGAQSDIGTPGFRAGGVLPVELSQFRPERQKDSGAVVITWSTQSELNNAGFFINRSRQRDGEFKVVNATMILGAGTTSEKQFYTYTDTTAQRDVVYYYQIEDVSLDGNRQTLTRGIRLERAMWVRLGKRRCCGVN